VHNHGAPVITRSANSELKNFGDGVLAAEPENLFLAHGVSVVTRIALVNKKDTGKRFVNLFIKRKNEERRLITPKDLELNYGEMASYNGAPIVLNTGDSLQGTADVSESVDWSLDGWTEP
jgi:hypothetical protein